MPRLIPYSGDAETLAGAVAITDPREDASVYVLGAYLSYWILDRHGPAVLTELWDETARGTTASEFGDELAQVSGDSLADLLAAAGTAPACSIVTCVGSPRPWVDGEWTVTAPTGCDDERVVGLIREDTATYTRTELVEVTQVGLYDLSTSGGAASIVACGGGCEQLGTEALLLDAEVFFPDLPSTELVLEPGIYRVQAQSSADVGGFEVRLRPVD